MTQVNMSLRIDAELKDAFMAVAKSMDRNNSMLRIRCRETLLSRLAAARALI